MEDYRKLKNFYKSVLYVKAFFYVRLNFPVGEQKKWEEFYE